MLGIERLAGAVVWYCLCGLNWIRAQFLHPFADWWLDSVLGTWEESTKSLLRETTAQSVRILDICLNALFGWFPGFQSTKTTRERPSAWQSWWAENRQSTFNAIIEDRHTFPEADAESPNSRAKHADQKKTSCNNAPLAKKQQRWWPWRRQQEPVSTNVDTSAPNHKRKSHDGEGIRLVKRMPAPKKLKRNGSDLFDRPAGWAVQEETKRGFLEDWRIGLELAITSVFEAVRWTVRKVLFMPAKNAMAPWGWGGRHTKRMDQPEEGDSQHSKQEGAHSVWTAAEVIQAAGYPLEEHTVITSDGYKLRMERLPRTGGRDVVFFMHGILDTSMGWVSNGVTGSQAFAAFDQGFDVWLGNSHKAKMGARYWHFNVNQLGQEDIEAQLEFIHSRKCDELPKHLAQAAHAAEDAQRRRTRVKVKKITSENDISALHPAASAEFQQELRDKSGQVSPEMQAASSSPDQSEPEVLQQAEAESPPRKRFGLFEGFRRRNKSESAAGSRGSSGPRLWGSKLPGAHQPKAIAESEEEEEPGVAVFESPRSQLASGSPDSAHSLSPATDPHSNGTPSPAVDTPSPPQQRSLLYPSALHPGGSQGPVPPPSPFQQPAGGTPAPHNPLSSPMSIPFSLSLCPSNEQASESSSAPPDLHGHIHRWAGRNSNSNGQEDAAAPLHQLPQASPSGHFEQGSVGQEGHHAARRSALHSSRSRRGRADSGSAGGQGIRFNDSRDSLWGSNEDLAQLVPDRASKGGLELAPEIASLTEMANRRSSTGFPALSAEDDEQPEAEQDSKEAAEEDDGDLVAAEQHKVKGEQSSRVNSRRSSRSGAHKEQTNGKAQEPYRLRAVGHSLGGASLLIYAVTRSLQGKPTHLTRLILLTPAGFQQNYPKAALPFMWILPPLVWALRLLRPGRGAACYIPSSLLRYITFKLTVDMQQIPALNELVRAGLRVLLNGDSSQWDRAMQMPHYNTRSMPSISFHTGMHLIQWIRTGRFQLYNYRSKDANREKYKQDTPLDIAANYGVLKMPVDIMAGKSDGVIAKENVLMHYQRLQEANCSVTYKEFDFGHLDFTFAVKDDLRHYVLSRLLMDS
ncbi:hypothetical protein ABBQ38_004253 [Trebouxia sp. C0009 RCD-2024]